MSYWDAMIIKAIANIKKIFSNKHEVGKQIGETIAGIAIKSVYQELILGSFKVKLTETDRISIDKDGTINHAGNGQCVAIIYDGSDGKHYKHTVDSWYKWSGSDWVKT